MVSLVWHIRHHSMQTLVYITDRLVFALRPIRYVVNQSRVNSSELSIISDMDALSF